MAAVGAAGAALAGVIGAFHWSLIRASMLGLIDGFLTGLFLAPFATLAAAPLVNRRLPGRRLAVILALACPFVACPSWYVTWRGLTSLLASQAACSEARAVALLTEAAATSDWMATAAAWDDSRPRSCMGFGIGRYGTFEQEAPALRISTAEFTDWWASEADVASYQERYPNATVARFDQPALCLSYVDEEGGWVMRCVAPDRLVDPSPFVLPVDW